MKSKFPERLKELRVSAGFTQKQLSDALNGQIDQSSIARWEAGTRIPLLDVAIVFAEYFGVSMDYLVGLED